MMYMLLINLILALMFVIGLILLLAALYISGDMERMRKAVKKCLRLDRK